MSTGRAPFSQAISATVPGVAAGVGQSVILGEVQEAATLSEVSILPAAAVAANGSNYRTWTVYNRGTNGAGNTAMATMDTSASVLVDNDERLMTPSGTPANLQCAAGDVLEVVETVTGTGVLHAGYTITATLARL